MDTEEEQYEEEIIDLITRIMLFNQAYKRKKNLKKPTKIKTDKSSQNDSASVSEDEEDDKVEAMTDKKIELQQPVASITKALPQEK